MGCDGHAPPAANEAAIPDVPIYRLTVGQYHAMARAGILDEDAPVELLERIRLLLVRKRGPKRMAKAPEQPMVASTCTVA